MRPDAARFLAPGTRIVDAFPALALKYNPNQPRVPAGHSDGGQWTSGSSGDSGGADTAEWSGEASDGEELDGEIDFADDNPGFDPPGAYDAGDLAFDAAGAQLDLGEQRLAIEVSPIGEVQAAGDTQPVSEGATNSNSLTDGDKPYDTRLASNEDKPKLGQNSRVAIVAELGRRIVRAFRSENGLLDLFNNDTGTVSYIRLDDRDIFGSNSTSPTYTSQDRDAADRLRDILIEKYPDKVQIEDIGRKPNDALYHAETNVLLRSAKESGGTLAGRSVEIYVDRPLCNSCRRIVPLVGLELGNPEITVVDPDRVFSIANGRITSQRLR